MSKAFVHEKSYSIGNCRKTNGVPQKDCKYVLWLKADLAAAEKEAENHRLIANGLENGQVLLERKLEDMRTVINYAIDGIDALAIISDKPEIADLMAIKETLEQSQKGDVK